MSVKHLHFNTYGHEFFDGRGNSQQAECRKKAPVNGISFVSNEILALVGVPKGSNGVIILL